MSRERQVIHESIISPRGYYEDPRVSHAILSYLGGSGKLWDTSGSIHSEYLGIGTREKLHSGKKSPVSTIKPESLHDWIKSSQGYAEIYTSLLQKDKETYPERVLFVWDIERFGNKEWIYHNQQEVFETLEPVYQLYKQQFDRLHIPFISIATGQGWHFVTSISTKESMNKLIQIGNVIEPSVAGKQRYPSPTSKRDHNVGVHHELAFKGAVRIQQLVNMMLIEDARKHTSRYHLPIEIWDKGIDGIALDNTAASGTVDTRTIGTLGSLYFLKPIKYNVWLPRMFIRIPREGIGYTSSLEKTLSYRTSYGKSAEYLESVDCHIPDASRAMDSLFDIYHASHLKQLHQSMDATIGDDPLDFNKTYRLFNYEAIIQQTAHPQRVRSIIHNANDQLLKPEEMDFVVWQLFEAFGGSVNDPITAPHVAGVLRAILEDPQFNWGTRWTRHYDATRYARGCTEQILGQAFS